MDQMLHHRRADVQQVGQAARGHGAPVEGELLHRALEGVLPACPAQFEGVIRAAGHRVLRRYRLRSHHVVLRLRARATPMTRMPAATRASGQSRRTAWFRLTRSDASAALTRALVFTSAALAWALAFTSATACSGSGGVALLMRCLPSSAARPATASRAAPTMSAASQAATTPLIAMIAQASRQPTP